MTMTDPFAPTPDEAQLGSNDLQKAPIGTVTVDVTPVIQKPLFANTEIVTTLKGGNGYDQPWVVIHAGSVSESDALLDQEFADYLAKVKRVAAHFNSGGVASAPSNTVTVNSSAPPPGATSAPNGETRTCKHGDMTFKSGFSDKTNKTWKAFMCPTPKGTPDQCDAEWLR